MKEPDEVKRLQRRFAVGHTAFLLVVFLPPLALALHLGLGPDVIFFAGRGMAFLLVAVVVALFLPLMHMCFRPTNRFLLTSVWLPAAVLAFVAFMYRHRTTVATDALMAQPCFDNDDKKGLQEAYLVANNLYGACMAWRPPPTGAPEEVDSVTECPEYHSATRKYRKEFIYLATLERRFPCGGVCYPGRRLWVDPGTYGLACSPFAAQWLRSAHTQSQVLLGYSLFVMIALIPSHMFLLAPMVRRYDHVLHANPHSV